MIEYQVKHYYLGTYFMTVKVQLRKADLEDATRLLSWRNDEESRQSSHQSQVISVEEHCTWLKASLANSNRKLYIALYNQEPIGSVRADFLIEQNIWQLSWVLAPQKRGLGLAKLMVLALVETIPDAIKAEIKANNHASIRVAEYAGLVLAESNYSVLTYARPAILDKPD